MLLLLENANVSQCWSGGNSSYTGGTFLNNHNWVGSSMFVDLTCCNDFAFPLSRLSIGTMLTRGGRSRTCPHNLLCPMTGCVSVTAFLIYTVVITTMLLGLSLFACFVFSSVLMTAVMFVSQRLRHQRWPWSSNARPPNFCCDLDPAE